MAELRPNISNLIRSLRLSQQADNLRFLFQKIKNYSKNNSFKKAYPNIAIPPDYLIYESFQLNYEKYYHGGKNTAKWLINLLSDYYHLDQATILDWGCGPGRIVRHLPTLLPESKILGTDYNPVSIEWCRHNLDGISFNNNALNADLPYENESIDVIYGISILTHLSEKMHHEWVNELYRVLKVGGVLLLTTQGKNFYNKLTGKEKLIFESDQLVVRADVTEGHRTYSAFHPVLFMNKLFSSYEILDHIILPVETGKAIPQDIWIVRKSR